MLKIHVKLLSKVLMLSLRDMEVGMIYKGNKGLPKIVVRKTKGCVYISNVAEGKVCGYGLKNNKHKQGHRIGTMPRKVFAIAKNDPRDIEKLVTKTQSV